MTQPQLWRGLEMKAADPLEFVPGMESCKIIEHYDDGLLREILLRGQRLQERITFTQPITVHFARVGTPGWIINTISESDFGLLLTFSFAMAFAGIPSGSEEEQQYGGKMRDNYRRAIETTLATTRRLVKAGQI
ncbi:hypothetical protein ECAE60S_02953 [Eoetvoesiella caeni]